jgi:hypothetical protein
MPQAIPQRPSPVVASTTAIEAVDRYTGRVVGEAAGKTAPALGSRFIIPSNAVDGE